MRVLHVYSGNLFGGVESILVTIARFQHLAPAARHEFVLCFDGRLREELAAAGATVHVLPPVRLRRPDSLIAARRALAALIARGRFDRVVCHAPWSHAMFAPTVVRADVPLIFWAHDQVSGRHWTERLARRNPPDLVCCNSRFTASAIDALYPGVPAAVMYAPVPAGPSVPDDHRRRMRASLDTAADAVVLVQASRLDPLKGHLLLIEALARLVDDVRWTLWMAGSAATPAEQSYFQSVRAAAGRVGIADRIRCLGARTDVNGVLAAADIYCQANVRPDAFGVAFVEALAAGLPVVTTDLGGAPEIVDGSCGVLVPANDPERFAQAIHRLIADRACRDALASRGPERARRLCDPATQLAELARTLAAIPQPSPSFA